ncbi:PepSY-associated TM helix domain-containing protein [Cytophaga sp. FL35]|uniref:PepSY-associated TM helix domain-containing protein n=1 Tax=Cytophaga sp. FL35 TaxID=1904456 RepID=UPI001653B493|nr:PepSY-associated TM helix domain-containing protein [Cytophaga sp. FL35]MBC6999349.1 PepSY domain-containing protein [Cytophaga sp. FL35]
MPLNKKLFFKIHSWIGVKLSILFFIVCFSGTVATLSHELDWIFIKEIRAKPQKELIDRNTIIENFRKLYPNANITYWMRTDEPYLCDIIYKNENGRQRYVFANPYTGAIQGEAALTIQRFFRDLHYFLFIPFYQIGYLIVLSFAFLLLISVISALYFYKKWWKKFFTFKKSNNPLVIFRSLHRLVGLWSLPFAILFSITGIWYFVERTNIADVRTKVNPDQPLNTVNAKSNISSANASLDYNRAVAMAEREIPDMTVGSITPPNRADGNIYLRGTSTVPLVRQRANRVYVNPVNYEVTGVQKAQNISTLMWVNDIADPLHFGYWGGLLTKIIWFFAGAGICILVLTGIWITLKRKKIKKKKNSVPVMGKWRYLNWLVSTAIVFFMYANIIKRYAAEAKVVIIVSLGCLAFISLGYYIFVYRLNRAVSKL